MINEEENSDLFQKLIIEEMIRNTAYGRNLLTKKIEDYELKSLSSIEKKDQIVFGADILSLDRIFKRLYSKRKVKFLRDIDNLNEKQDFKDIDYFSLPEEQKSIRNQEDYEDKMFIQLNTKKTKKRNRVIKIIKPSVLVQQQNNENMLDIDSGNKNMFGITDKSEKVKVGKCDLPFNMTTRHKVSGKNVSRPWHSYKDCVLSKDGPFCATETVKTRKAVQGKLKKLKEYQETGKHGSKKGYCNWEEFFKRVRREIKRKEKESFMSRKLQNL